MASTAAELSTLLCIHGFSGSWRNWDPVIGELGRHHRVQVARLAGHADGPELAPGTAVTVTALADQLERDLDRMGLDRAHLVGNSLGGWLSLELAARGRALSVTALSPALGWYPGPHLRVLRLKLIAGRTVFSAITPFAGMVLKSHRLRRALFGGVMAHSERLEVADLAAFSRDNLRCTIYFDLMKSFLGAQAQLGEVTCPVRIEWSEYDALIPRAPFGARFPALLPNARFSTIAGVGHVPMYDDPVLVSRTVTDFTTAVDAGRDTAS